MKRLTAWVINLLFPQRCCMCGRVIAWHDTMCDACLRDAPYVLPPICNLCGRGEDRCRCRKRRRYFERCVMPFYYEGICKHGISQIKKSADSSVAAGFAAEMAEMLRREYGGVRFDCITAVPQHKKELRRKGYNPAAMLARELSHLTGIPFIPNLIKLYQTTPQKELRAIERSGNLSGVFEVDKPHTVAQKTVLLVDDTVTTGSTLDECAKMLKIYGAIEVYAVTAAGSTYKEDKGEAI